MGTTLYTTFADNESKIDRVELIKNTDQYLIKTVFKAPRPCIEYYCPITEPVTNLVKACDERRS